MKLSMLISFIALFATAGCGGNVVGGNTGGTGGTGGSGGAGGGDGGGGSTGSTTSTTVVPPECAVETSETAPFAVTFKFTSTTNQDVYLREDCFVSYTVTSCADGYQEPISLSGFCTSDCSQQNECIVCGACPESAVLVSPAVPVDTEWSGKTYTFEDNAAGCQCHVEHTAPAGKYRITVPVYSTEENAMLNQPAGMVSTDFDLPAPGGIVEVPVFYP